MTRVSLGVKKCWRVVLSVAFISAVSVTGLAQEAVQKETNDGPKAQPAAKPNAEMTFRKGSKLPPQTQIQQARDYLNQMKGVESRVQSMARKARADRDLIKLDCINDKLLEIKGNMRLAERFIDKLRVAAASGDEGSRNHEFAKITITYQKVTVRGQEADACVGEEIAYVGQTRVAVDIDDAVKQAGNATNASPTVPVQVGWPIVASPSQ